MHKPVKKHWYLLSFFVQHPGAWIPSSFVHGFDNMRITVPELRVAKQINHVGDNSVMLAVCYMGFATEREINGVPEIDPPSYTSKTFVEGFMAASLCPASDSVQPVNPYSLMDTNDPHVQHDAEEWKLGFDTQRTAEVTKTVSAPKIVGDKPTVLEPPPKQQK